MALEFEISGLIPASPEVVYRAWLDSETHTNMTGGEAAVSEKGGEEFMAWDGYITGTNLELETGQRILQRWRTSEFEGSDTDSILEILFEEENGQTLITIRHSNLPEHGMQYKQGWIDNYLDPMREYFGGK